LPGRTLNDEDRPTRQAASAAGWQVQGVWRLGVAEPKINGLAAEKSAADNWEGM
jgi:hypothetical protein